MLVAGLPIAHDAVGDAMAEGPSRRRRNRRRLHPVRTKPVRMGALADPRYVRRADTGCLAPPFKGTGRTSATPSRPEIRTAQPRVCQKVWNPVTIDAVGEHRGDERKARRPLRG